MFVVMKGTGYLHHVCRTASQAVLGAARKLADIAGNEHVPGILI